MEKPEDKQVENKFGVNGMSSKGNFLYRHILDIWQKLA